MRKGRFIGLSVTLIAMLAITVLGGPQAKHEMKGKSLYDRLGGSEMLGKIFDDVGGRMAADPLLAQFFQGQSQEALASQRQRTLDFLCHETGGPCEYKGQPLKNAHGSLHITNPQFDAFLKHLGESLDQLKVGATEKKDMLALARKFRTDVVSKK